MGLLKEWRFWVAVVVVFIVVNWGWKVVSAKMGKPSALTNY